MPTNILYHEAYFKPRDGQSFFEFYNYYALPDSLRNHAKSIREEPDIIFLSRPHLWAEYVVNGIKKQNPDRNQQLKAVGQFLLETNFFGFSLESLAASHIQDILSNYVRPEQLLREDERTKEISSEAVDYILGRYSVRSRTTIIPTGYGKKEKFVQNTNTRRRDFWNTVGRLLETDEIKLYLDNNRVLTAWNQLREETKALRAIVTEDEYISPRKEYPVPLVDIFTYGKEMERTRMEEERIKRIETEREMLIQSEPGIEICRLIKGGVPPKKERQEVLEGVKNAVSQYAPILELNNYDGILDAEINEIARRVFELRQDVNNVFTRKIRSEILTLERLVRR